MSAMSLHYTYMPENGIVLTWVVPFCGDLVERNMFQSSNWSEINCEISIMTRHTQVNLGIHQRVLPFLRTLTSRPFRACY